MFLQFRVDGGVLYVFSEDSNIVLEFKANNPGSRRKMLLRLSKDQAAELTRFLNAQ